MKEVFFKFLELHGCKDKFIKNFDPDFGYVHTKCPDKYFERLDKKEYLGDAFSWSGSEEGHNFWENIHIKWYNTKIYKSNKLNQKLYKNKIYFETEEIIYVKN